MQIAIDGGRDRSVKFLFEFRNTLQQSRALKLKLNKRTWLL